ncbi:hypothetical protein ES703_49406 [subsurface metagenome]
MSVKLPEGNVLEFKTKKEKEHFLEDILPHIANIEVINPSESEKALLVQEALELSLKEGRFANLPRGASFEGILAGAKNYSDRIVFFIFKEEDMGVQSAGRAVSRRLRKSSSRKRTKNEDH